MASFILANIVSIMACCLFDVKPLPELMMIFCEILIDIETFGIDKNVFKKLSVR